jgi:aspartate/methionine/tyrosine aminotransferase
MRKSYSADCREKQSMGEGYLRLCFANSDEIILEGVRRIKAFVTKEFPLE